MEGKKRASESDAEAFPSKRRTPCKNPTLVIVGGDAKARGVSVCVCIWDMHVRCMHMHFHVHNT
jgi:hypothetical protein